MSSSPDEAFLTEVLRALEESGLEALVVGAVAAVMQGAPFMTRDLDLIVRDTRKNREKILRFARALRARPPMRASELSRTITLLGPALPIDIVFDELPGGLRFASLRSRSVKIPLGKHVARAISLEDVIASKEAANRPKDRAALPLLRDAKRVRDLLRKKR